MKPDNDRLPILVTGAHRSGTTWVGQMLAASSEVGYISEPLNKLHRPGVMRAQVAHWYPYICQENEGRYLAAMQETLAFNYHVGRELLSLRSSKDAGRMGRDLGRFLSGKLRHCRPLLKDPFAVFSVPWFIERLSCQVVITLRHPAAFVSSLKRLNWTFDFRDLLDQPLLLRDRLEPYRGAMEAALVDEDVIAQGSLLWKLIYGVVAEYRISGLKLLLARHEDLSRQPVDGFRQLYASLGLGFNPGVERALIKSSQSSNPGELSSRRVHAIKLDSAANLSNWKHRLKKDEVYRIRELTAAVADRFYEAESWE